MFVAVDKLIKLIKRDMGIIYCFILASIFLIVEGFIYPYFDGPEWYVVGSLVRFLFGIAELFLFVKVYKKEKWTNVIHFKNVKDGLRAGSGLILLIIFYASHLLIGVKAYTEATFSTVILCLFLAQMETGFWEEMAFRAFLTEGYFTRENRTWKTRLCYAFISFVAFGLAHVIGCDSFSFAVYRFLITGLMGFVYAAIYLHSHNIFVPMLLHFVYDIFANANGFVAEWSDSKLFMIWDNYVYFVVLGVMLIISVIYIIKKDVKNDICDLKCAM